MPSLSDARRVISSRTRMVVVNFPHNPTGTTISPAEQSELVGLCAEVGAYLVWDAAFAPLVYESAPLPEPTLSYERAVSIGTLSKAFGLPGMRIGWCIATPDVLSRMARLRDHTTLHLSPLVERIAERVVRHAERFVAPRLQQARLNRSIVGTWVDGHEGQVAWTAPIGGVCAAVQFPRVRNIEALCRRLAEKHRTLVVPGTCFGDPRWIRLGFGGATSELREGLRRLDLALQEGDQDQCASTT